MPGYLNANRDIAHNGGYRQVLRQHDSGVSAAIFPIDAGHGLDLAFEASDFRHKFILGQLLNVMEYSDSFCTGGALDARNAPSPACSARTSSMLHGGRKLLIPLGLLRNGKMRSRVKHV
jgi:hypothetical protein